MKEITVFALDPDDEDIGIEYFGLDIDGEQTTWAFPKEVAPGSLLILIIGMMEGMRAAGESSTVQLENRMRLTRHKMNIVYQGREATDYFDSWGELQSHMLAQSV
jgi:hypothetical protein